MAQQQYDNQGNPVKKKPFKIKIAGFSFGLGQIIAVAVLIGLVFLISFMKSEAQRKADQEAYEQKMAELEAMKNNFQPNEQLDIHAQIQASLSERFGVAPEGFEWGYTGELIALGNDDDHNCEDVVYMFLRSISMLDFSTAARYSEESTIINGYQEYYGLTSEIITDYYRNFLRKQYKCSLSSIEVEGISDVAVFADGTQYLTIKVKVLDLQDKDFWQKDRDDLFKMMRVYKETETDTTKMEQYVYDYIYSKYEDGTIGKKSHTIELVVSKQNGGGWLVSGDRELNAYLQYENGVDVADFILNEFSNWYMETTLKEQLDSIGALTSGGSSSSTPPEEEADGGDEYYEGTEVEPDSEE